MYLYIAITRQAGKKYKSSELKINKSTLGKLEERKKSSMILFLKQ